MRILLSVNKVLPIISMMISLISGYDNPRLPFLGPLASDIISISGFSSGGGKALQIYLSHSSQIRGVGLMSAIMYRCETAGLIPSSIITLPGKPFEAKRLLQCSMGTYNYEKALNKIVEESGTLIDHLDNLQWGRQFVHGGTSDIVVLNAVAKNIVNFLNTFSPNVLFNQTNSAHGFPTASCGLSCPSNLPPLPRTSCRTCGWDAAYQMLNHIYSGTLHPPKWPPGCGIKNSDLEGTIFPFDQTEFFPEEEEGGGRLNMARKGYIFIPPQCQEIPSSCVLHVHIHGCGHAAALPTVNLDDIKCTGILGVAAANNIIVLFPQTRLGFTTLSGLGQCWDFVGYTGQDYGNKRGAQVRAIMGMVYRVLGRH